MKFSDVADWLEKVMAHPAAFVLFILWCVFVPKLDIDAANYGISVVTALLLFLTLGNSRRDRLAVQTKLDELIVAVVEADTEHAGLEDKLTEKEIKEIKSKIGTKTS